MSTIKNKTTRDIITFIMLTVGTIIAAAALECFLIPNTILDGGVTGISIIIFKLFNIPLWLLVVLLNIPFIFIGYKNLGERFLLRAIYSMLCFSLFIAFFELIPPFTDEIILAVVFGGALLLFLLSSTGQAFLEAFLIRNENLESHGDISNHRFDLWAAYISVFNSDPILWFMGLGDYREYGILKQAHNFLIEDLAAYGIIGVSILYLTYRSIYVHQYKFSKCLNSIKMGLFSKIPFLVPIMCGMYPQFSIFQHEIPSVENL